MHAQIHTIAFRGIEMIAVTVQTHIALGLMVARGVVPRDVVEDALVLGELALDGAIQPVSGVLPAAIAAAAVSRDLICPHDCGSEAAWAEGLSRTALFVNRIIQRQWRHFLVAVYAPSWVKFPWQIMGFYFLMNWLNFRASFLIRFANYLKSD